MRKVPIALGAAASLLALGLSAGAAQASADGSAHVTHVAYVSHSAKKNGADTSCKTAKYRDINTAIAAVSAGGTVVVCAGTYDQQVVVGKPLALVGRGATINAKGQKPGWLRELEKRGGRALEFPPEAADNDAASPLKKTG